MKRLLSIVVCLTGGLVAGAQSADPITQILKEIEQNNLSLQAARQEQTAEVLEAKAENNLSDPSVEYVRQYSKHTSDAEDELVVTQEFDFPTAYAARSRYNRLQANAAQSHYAAERRNILLEAKVICLDLIRLNQQEQLIRLLATNADSLVTRSDKRLQSGDATALEANRAQLNQMSLRTELADNASEHRLLLQRLLAMNAGHYLPELTTGEYPQVPELPSYEVVRDEVIPVRHELQEAASASDAARKLVSVEQAGWLPKLAVGYRRNTAPGEELNGFIVGASLPLFENRHKVKAARARSVSAALRQEELALQVEAQLQGLYNEARQVKEAMEVYDLPLIERSFTLLSQSLQGGEISWHEYYEELEALVRRKLDYLQLENRYQKLMAEIYADRL